MGASEENKNTLHGYICKVKSSKMYFKFESNYFMIPDQSGSKFILCQRKVLATDTFVSCLNCKNEFVYENIKNIDNVRNLKNEYCQHAKVCEILFEEKNEKEQNRQEHFIEILLPCKNRKQEICLVHPSGDSEKIPGIIRVQGNQSATHVNVFILISF